MTARHSLWSRLIEWPNHSGRRMHLAARRSHAPQQVIVAMALRKRAALSTPPPVDIRPVHVCRRSGPSSCVATFGRAEQQGRQWTKRGGTTKARSDAVRSAHRSCRPCCREGQATGHMSLWSFFTAPSTLELPFIPLGISVDQGRAALQAAGAPAAEERDGEHLFRAQLDGGAVWMCPRHPHGCPSLQRRRSDKFRTVHMSSRRLAWDSA